jgi:hypothetical protein
VESKNEAAIFGYKETEECTASLADQLLGDVDYGTIDKPIIL